MRQARRGHRVRKAQRGEGFGQKLTGGIGNLLSNAAQHGLSTLLGAGDYETAINEEFPDETHIAPLVTPGTNSLFQPVSSQNVPMMHNASQGAVRISRREFVRNLQSPSAIGQDSFTERIPLNIGDALGTPMAPWLTQIAKHWQKYSFLGLAFEYIPTSGVLSSASTPALGSINFGILYEVPQNAVTGFTWTQTAILNLDGASSGSPATSQIIPVECAPDSTVIPVKFVSDNSFNVPTDLNLYSLGELIVMVQGTVTTGTSWTPGQLWVTYDVMLEGTKLPGNVFASSFFPEKLQALVRRWKDLAIMRPGTPVEMVEWEDHRDDLYAKLRDPSVQRAFRHAQLKATLANERAEKDLNPTPNDWTLGEELTTL